MKNKIKNKPRVLLINSPTGKDIARGFTSTQYPLSLASLGTYLENKGIDVVMFDFCVMDFDKEWFINSLDKIRPDFVGVSCMTPTVNNGYKLIKIVKEYNPKIVSIMGGCHTTALPKQSLEEFPLVDFVVVGEGEYTTEEAISRIKSGKSLKGVKGIAHRVNGKIIVEENRELIADLDSMPFPKRDFVDISLYKKTHVKRGISRKFMNIAEIMTSRGCPNACIFCATHIAYGFKVRFRSAEKIIEEIRMIVRDYKVNHITILDDTFTLKKSLVYTICDEFKRLGLTWDCDTRVNFVTSDLLKKMKESGCIKVLFGIESGSDRMLKLIKKGITIEKVKKAYKWANEAGIKYIEAAFIVGAHPSETKDELMQSIKLAKQIKAGLIYVGVVVPFPGTELYQIMKDNNLMDKDVNWDQFAVYGTTLKWRTFNFSKDELLALQKKFFLNYYLDPRVVFNILRKIDSWPEFKYWFDIGMAFVKDMVKKR